MPEYPWPVGAREPYPHGSPAPTGNPRPAAARFLSPGPAAAGRRSGRVTLWDGPHSPGGPGSWMRDSLTAGWIS
ncbi:hypothetical protein ALMP_74130 [Streptomyces sp. A012304]|nr:hypothetical protein ALMP_74130 [Streptomyces sp. A012304]